MSNEDQQQPVSRSKPVRLLFAVAAGATVISTGLPVITPDQYDWIGAAVGLVALVITGAVTAYTEGQTVPFKNVAARKLDDGPKAGQTVAGPASPVPTNAPVDVTAAGSGDYTPPSVSPPPQ
jgi:hypothetical protein